MRVTIEVGDNYLAAIKRTGSVQSILNSAAILLEGLETPVDKIEESIVVVDQVNDIAPMLNHIHQQIRDQVLFGPDSKGQPVPA